MDVIGEAIPFKPILVIVQKELLKNRKIELENVSSLLPRGAAPFHKRVT